MVETDTKKLVVAGLSLLVRNLRLYCHNVSCMYSCFVRCLGRYVQIRLFFRLHD